MDAIRVLIVDDEQDFATAVVARLTRRGFRAAAAFSGREAIESVKSTQYDAIVLDLKMPEMDGLQTLHLLQQIDPNLAVVVLTGHGTVASGIGGMRLGAAEFLRKPVSIETLCTAVEAAAERTRADRGPGIHT
jgi:two-component system OmpR family response regulator